MDDSLYSDDLIHYGVKGMKWGIRRKRKSSSKRSFDDIKQAVVKGKASVDRFMQSNAGRAVKSAAVIALAAAGVLWHSLSETMSLLVNLLFVLGVWTVSIRFIRN